jgi:hypothetical protein
MSEPALTSSFGRARGPPAPAALAHDPAQAPGRCGLPADQPHQRLRAVDDRRPAGRDAARRQRRSSARRSPAAWPTAHRDPRGPGAPAAARRTAVARALLVDCEKLSDADLISCLYNLDGSPPPDRPAARRQRGGGRRPDRHGRAAGHRDPAAQRAGQASATRASRTSSPPRATPAPDPAAAAPGRTAAQPRLCDVLVGRRRRAQDVLQRFAVSREILQDAVGDVFALASAEGWQDPLSRKALQFIERRQRNRAAIAKSPYDSLDEGVAAAQTGMTREIAEEISYLSGLKPMTGAKIFTDPGGEPLAILCKATGLPRGCVRALWRGLRRQEVDASGRRRPRAGAGADRLRHHRRRPRPDGAALLELVAVLSPDAGPAEGYSRGRRGRRRRILGAAARGDAGAFPRLRPISLEYQ